MPTAPLASQSQALTYQDALRAIGRLLDQEHWTQVSVMETDSAIIVHGVRPGQRGPEPALVRLTPGDLTRVVEEVRQDRGEGRPAPRPQHSRLAALQQRQSLPPLSA